MQENYRKIGLLFFLILSIFVSYGKCYSEPKSYSDTDLGKYEHNSEPKSEYIDQSNREETKKQDKQTKADKTGHGNDPDYWCNEATRLKDNIELAKKELELLIRLWRPDTFTEADMVNARMKVEKAKQELDHLEDKAHRNGILPGWLRCQF